MSAFLMVFQSHSLLTALSPVTQIVLYPYWVYSSNGIKVFCCTKVKQWDFVLSASQLLRVFDTQIYPPLAVS